MQYGSARYIQLCEADYPMLLALCSNSNASRAFQQRKRVRIIGYNHTMSRIELKKNIFRAKLPGHANLRVRTSEDGSIPLIASFWETVVFALL